MTFDWPSPEVERPNLFSLVLQACDVEALTNVHSVTWTVLPEPDWKGLPQVEIVGPQDAILAFVLAEWGDEDPEWFASLPERMSIVWPPA